MKCFIHGNQEAVAVCKKCGKAMCASCSSYSGHSGLCPVCRKQEFELKRTQLSAQIETYKWPIVGYATLTILFFWTIIGGIYGGYKWYKCTQEKNAKQLEVLKLTQEINKLNKALNSRSAVSSI